MKYVTFYLCEKNEHEFELTAPERLACSLAVDQWQIGKRILIACQDQQQAERLDEALWRLEPAHFVPHNLAGEGPRYGAPVELCWPEKRGQSTRQLLINLQQDVAHFAVTFNDIIDFVPEQEAHKQLARERYKTYRRLGFLLDTKPASSYKLS